jgi:hypothetical protein
MKFTKLLPAAAGLILAGAAQVASASVVVLPGVALPAGVPALPSLTLGGGGALALPGVPSLPLPLPVALPIPTSGGSLAIVGGVGGAYVIQPTVITATGVDLPALPVGALPALPGLPK